MEWYELKTIQTKQIMLKYASYRNPEISSSDSKNLFGSGIQSLLKTFSIGLVNQKIYDKQPKSKYILASTFQNIPEHFAIEFFIVYFLKGNYLVFSQNYLFPSTFRSY